MLAANVGAVVGGIIVDQFDVGGQAGARIRALDQVVAEQRIARKTAIEHGMQRGHFVNSLAGKDAFAEQILVGVGNGAGVNIEAVLAGIDGGQPRLRGRSHRDAHARLQDSVAFGDDAALRDR